MCHSSVEVKKKKETVLNCTLESDT